MKGMERKEREGGREKADKKKGLGGEKKITVKREGMQEIYTSPDTG